MIITDISLQARNNNRVNVSIDKTKLYLKEHPEVLTEIDQKVRDKVKEGEN